MATWWIIGFLATFTTTIFLLIFLFATKIGTEGLRKWKNKKLFLTGGYTNALIFTKDNLLVEVFRRNVDGKFQYNDDPYVRVPSMSFPYKGLPTYLYIEGQPNPINIFSIENSMLLSCKELDQVMNQSNNFDFKAWFEANKLFILIGFGILVLMLAGSLFFGYTAYEWIRDSAPRIVSDVNTIASSSLT